MENVLSIVAANPRYHPKMPSRLKMSSKTDSIVSSSLRFPLAVDDVACIRVFALRRRGQCRLVSSVRYVHAHIEWIYYAAAPGGSVSCESVRGMSNTHALLKQAPKAPAKAAPNGVSC